MSVAVGEVGDHPGGAEQLAAAGQLRRQGDVAVGRHRGADVGQGLTPGSSSTSPISWRERAGSLAARRWARPALTVIAVSR